MAGVLQLTMDQRHEQILDLVKSCGVVRVVELADHLHISVATARRDVAALADRGLVNRARGVVAWPDGLSIGERLRQAAWNGSQADASSAGPVTGMVVPRTRKYFDEIIRGARQASASAGGRLVLGFSGYAQTTDLHIEQMIQSGVDGLLLTLDRETGASRQDSAGWELEVPTVLVERTGVPCANTARLDYVCTDEASGVWLAMEYLSSLGHERVALVGDRGDSTGAQIRMGYESVWPALEMAHPLVMSFGSPTDGPDTGCEAVADRLAEAVRKREVSAALVFVDSEPISLMESLQSRGIHVPGDVSLITYGDEVAFALLGIPLTAVALPSYHVGQSAVKLLHQRMRETAHNPADAVPRQHLALAPELRIRASCRPPAAGPRAGVGRGIDGRHRL
ncbi:LacI family DNA-binding transcriptional regulator [Streptomyces sp. FIT100]|uniref:LacI family DNA-binding transcriptional regulator n=1 Tax=Streptomyces sp. FIT100 TaxID=2837956 RepID=UPI0021C80C97|nr:substrate-binding domain-containing protein [Streptomyces sp. FIT100]UUN26761.1 substrate-binding domain-containing protein [Streptomyces sp. FIT100]